MLAIGLLIAGMVVASAGFAYRKTRRTTAIHAISEGPESIRDRPGTSADWAVDLARLGAVNERMAERLWKLGYHIHSEGRSSERMDDLIRDNVIAILQLDTLGHKYFPRRPTLMPQLMQAVNDPRTASDKLSRIIAHDPVLTADVLRLANSSLYRTSPAPVETIQRAVVVCGADALRAMVAAAMMKPVFSANSRNFPRLPRVLWERTMRAAHAAELYAVAVSPHDRFESQLVVLLNALGPLVVYGATVDVYLRNPIFPPNTASCVSLTRELAPQMALRVARDWDTSPRLVAALEKSGDDPLTRALQVGELLGTLSFLESQTVISSDERDALIIDAGLTAGPLEPIWTALTKIA